MGSLPNAKPKAAPDGACTSYRVKKGDTCSTIAAENGITVTDLTEYNVNTFGWTTCEGLQAGAIICLSSGTPPLPAPVNGAVCGPTKPGTRPPALGQNITDLNSCPLNACCSAYGYCGITPEFCYEGDPTAIPPKKATCVSNCGIGIVNQDKAPTESINVGYYESWNMDRPCLTMKAADIDTKAYSHVHWAFAGVTNDWCVDVNDTYKQFGDFTKLQGAKKIVSFGGWGYSTKPATFDKLRQALSPHNAGKFADNIVDFLKTNDVDGVDLDWEYPGATDIPGTPPGQPSDIIHYLAFLKLLRSKIPAGKSISIAAPASYHYLKVFPMSQMVEQLDYIVYLTYDLHGQWDYRSKFS